MWAAVWIFHVQRIPKSNESLHHLLTVMLPQPFLDAETEAVSLGFNFSSPVCHSLTDFVCFCLMSAEQVVIILEATLWAVNGPPGSILQLCGCATVSVCVSSAVNNSEAWSRRNYCGRNMPHICPLSAESAFHDCTLLSPPPLKCPLLCHLNASVGIWVHIQGITSVLTRLQLVIRL